MAKKNKKLTVQVVNQCLTHSFLYSSNAPVPLLGRDLLIKLGASILCSPQGVIVTFPDGTQVDCSQTAPTGCRQNVLLGGPLREATDIYWVELDISPSLMSVVVSHVWRSPTEAASTFITDCHKASSCHQGFLIKY